MVITFAYISEKQLMVAATVGTSRFFGALGILRIMTNLHFIWNEMDKETAEINWVKELQAIPIPILRSVFAGIMPL